VEPAELARELVELADAAGLEVRPMRDSAARESEPAASSGICRVRGEIWVMLAASDPVEEQISVLVRALKTHAAAFLESRYLPPALRDRLGAEIDPS
jgi:hypothetical protein